MNSTALEPLMPLDTNFRFSQSSLQDYVDCARRFQLRYIQDVHWPAVDAEPLAQVESRQREAMLFHRLVEQHYLHLPAASLTATARSSNLARWWQNFTAGAPDLDGWKLYTEKTLAGRIASHRIVCKYDLLAIRGGKAVIYDWKTFQRRPKNEWLAARLQTIAYRAVLALAGAELNGGRAFAASDVSMIYWFAEFPADVAVLDYDERQHQHDLQVLERILGEIASARAFPLTDDPERCGFCTYRSLCDRGQRARFAAEDESDRSSADLTDSGFEQIGEAQL
jgi:CRISPR/Cas system-associated exonuclease Cas4 (RecB family)